MPERPTDCFRTVSKHVGRLFRRLPKSRSWSENLKLIHSPSKSCSLTPSDCNYPCLQECQGFALTDRNQSDGQTEDAPPPGTCPVNNQPKSEERASMKGSISMSSGYCSQDEESDDFAFFTAKSSFFNQTHNQQETKGTDDPYTGFIEVHLKLRRPVSVETQGGTSGGSVGHEGSDSSGTLQAEEVKRIHVSSSNTVREVIQGLLGKFSAQNDPSRFTLYHQTHRDGQDVLQKLSLSDHPLYLRPGAGPETGPDPKPLIFVLRENDGAGVEWHAFSVPELQNFLTILTKEEELRVRQVERRYRQYREKLCQVLQEAQGKPG